jgi:hypothetical protein
MGKRPDLAEDSPAYGKAVGFFKHSNDDYPHSLAGWSYLYRFSSQSLLVFR